VGKKVSIITVALNNKEGLKHTMESVFAQTFNNYEYIIIDGGSTDGSCELIKHHEQKVHYWISEPDKGIYQAMNKGWRQATGEYCIFLNSGDYFLNEDILKNVFLVIDDSMDITYGDVMFKYKDKVLRETHYEKMSLYKFSYTNIPHQGTFIKRDLLIKLNGYDESYRIISDWLFLFRAFIDYNIKISKIDQVISVFDMYGLSNTQKYDDERINAIRKYYPFMEDVFNDFRELRQYKLSTAHKIVKKLVKFKNKLIN